MADMTTRRQMLALAAIGAAGATLIGCSTGSSKGAVAAGSPSAVGQPLPSWVKLPEAPPAPPAPGSVGIAIVGLGGYALGPIMPAIAQSRRCHIAGLVSGNPEKAARVAAAYGVPADAIYSYDAFDSIARDDRIEAVYIILPSGLHAEYAIRAFGAGKHVLCEKPMALNAEECERMVAAGAAAGRKLMIGYRCHFEPVNLRAMALMRERAVGAPRVIRTDHNYVMGPTNPAKNWRVNRALAGGGPLEDFGIYGLQAALYLTGEMPDSVSAKTAAPAGDPRFSETFASVVSQFRFPSGALAQLATSYDAAFANRVEARGDDGVLLMDPATGYQGNTLTLRRHSGEEPLNPGESGVQFLGQMDHFAASIRDGVPLLTPGEMGLRDMRLIDAIYASARSGETIALAPDGRMRG